MNNVCQGKRPCEMKVLDFGCGSGRVTRSLGKLFGEVLGTPLSEPDMLEIADRTGFESRYRVGEGQESYWHWFFKK